MKRFGITQLLFILLMGLSSVAHGFSFSGAYQSAADWSTGAYHSAANFLTQSHQDVANPGGTDTSGTSSHTDADLLQVLGNINNLVNYGTVLLMVVCFVAGMFFIFKSLLLFKKTAMQGINSSTQADLKAPLTYFIIGGILLAIPSASDYTVNSIFGETASPFDNGTVNFQSLGTGAQLIGYELGTTLTSQWLALANTLVLIIQFIGFISFARGWFIIAKSSEGQSQQASFGKGLTHVLGGAIAINFYNAVLLIQNSIMGGS